MNKHLARVLLVLFFVVPISVVSFVFSRTEDTSFWAPLATIGVLVLFGIGFLAVIALGLWTLEYLVLKSFKDKE